jgi:phosphoribosyl-ATP pyrophosphohydrolase
MADFSLEDLERIVAQRAQAEATTSYTRALLDDGPPRCAKKLGEEGVELALAVAAGERAQVIAEAADVLYHLVVALKSRDVPLAEVLEELQRRTAQSGLAEKAGRAERA